MLAPASPIASEIVAALGPTNTGKTHRAVERMLDHDSGMIGLPLRLLAREVYDKVTARVGEQRVALVTGEEKRVPRRPDYWICTVEAMPMDRDVDFLAVDEIQLVSHPTRGHMFTQRLLHARGRKETWFLGSATVKKLLSELVPSARHTAFPRLSRLSCRGSVPLGRLPPRSAVVAFSLPEVYELAERLRARKGGAAVVLGALSPRTRNAQVAMYQAGEVDYLVATDAIGMGLNMNVDHVAFAGFRKFDGRATRELSAWELAQIAGRAGRHLSNGTFGTLASAPDLPEHTIQAIENHRFEPQRAAWWRSSDLDLSSAQALLDSLAARPRHPALRHFDDAEDALALRRLLARESVHARCRDVETLRLLWDVCQVPDYRKLLPEAHAELLGGLFEELLRGGGTLRDSWLEERVNGLDNTQGDIDTLLGRIAFIRTWTYVSQRAQWVQSRSDWQRRARDVEDRLSDALHERLLQRFVERRRRRTTPERALRPSHEKAHEKTRLTQGRTAPAFEPLWRLQLQLADSGSSPEHAAFHSLIQEAIDATHDDFQLSPHGEIVHDNLRLGRLVAGKTLLHPEVSLDHLDLDAGEQQRLRRRLVALARDVVDSLQRGWSLSERLSPAARGLVYQLRQGLGSIETRDARSEIAHLLPQDRQELAQRGIRLGQRFAWVQSLLRPGPLLLRRALCEAHFGELNLPQPIDGRPSYARTPKDSPTTWLRLGHAALGPRAVRCDIAERALACVQAAPEDAAALASLMGCPRAELPGVLAVLIPKGRGRNRNRVRRKRAFSSQKSRVDPLNQRLLGAKEPEPAPPTQAQNRDSWDAECDP